MLKIALFTAIAVHMLSTLSQSGCSMNNFSMNPAAHADSSSQKKTKRGASEGFDPKINNGAYWAQQQVCKRQTA